MINIKLLKFQKMGITLKKDGVNPHFGSSYSTLNEVLEKVKAPLNEMGVLIIQNPEKDGLKTILLDTEDETKIESFMPYVETSTAQKLGSNNTYVRRYALVTMLGLEDADDDGNMTTPKASAKAYTAPQSAQATQATVASSDPMARLCGCGLAKKRVITKKVGPNQGRAFWACPKPQGQQCDGAFEWEDEGDKKVDIEGTREDFNKSTGAYEGGYSGSKDDIPVIEQDEPTDLPF